MILFEITSHETSMHVLYSNYNVSSSLHVSLGFNSHMLNAIHADVNCCYWNSNAYLIRSKKLNRQSHTHTHTDRSPFDLITLRLDAPPATTAFHKYCSASFLHFATFSHCRTHEHTNTCLPNNNFVSSFRTRRWMFCACLDLYIHIRRITIMIKCDLSRL